MTNLEKYEEQIKPMIYAGFDFALTKSGLVKCGETLCDECLLNDDGAHCARMKWLQQEYEEAKEPEFNWMNVKVDTPVLVSDNGADWYKRHFKSYYPESREVCTFNDGATSWSYTGYCKWKYAKLAESEVEK